MSTIWKLREPLIKYDDMDFITDKILKIRGIKNTYEFLNPSISSLNSPFALENMKIAVDKTVEYIFNGKKIGVYADPDTDGVISAAISYRYLKQFTDNIVILYHQRDEGHGVQVQNCMDNEVDLVIVVDSSTSSVSECKQLQEQGIEVIVLDHHIAETGNPCAIIVNPQVCNYPNKDLSGAGVVFQFCRAFDEVMGTEYAFDYIEFVAIALIGDMMDVAQPETRYLIYEGLSKIRSENRSIIIDMALKKLNSWYMPTATDIAFSLVPMINSAIRLGHIEWTIELFTTDDIYRAKDLIDKCTSLNSNRKKEQKIIINDLVINNDNSIIIINATENNINPAMRGLIANDIANTYKKPCLVVSEEGELMQGSGRSFGDIANFKDILHDTGLFTDLAGHQSAFGVEFNKNQMSNIYQELNKTLPDFDKEIVLEADLELEADKIDWSFIYDVLPLYLICGNGFEEPKFIIKDIKYDNCKVMGDFKNHFKLTNAGYEVVKFNTTDEIIKKASRNKYKNVLGTLGVNAWYHFGKKEMVYNIQIKADDLN
ncbi:DHH family phosphoesterase [Tissierella praeacuta]|uniref:DHH family phosphoesterase n=1 Tax=Tissierella praeacuta TaxID=43131 RepID=UPI003DA58668